MLERFDDYHLLQKIATGGMAEIYLAKHVSSPATSMPIAIKKILRQYSSNTAFVKMFLAEAKIICNISHENIVKIYDFGKFDSLYYIAMEYVFGQNLGQLMNRYENKDKNIPINIIMEISMAVLNGLDHAHNTKDKNGIFLNVIHLDMNPNNILLSYEGLVKVVDFGIAHATYTKLMKSKLESIQGTFGYLSPEQCREEQLDRRSDIFSFGIIMYEMLSGQPLFKHLENDAIILNKIANEDIPDIKTIRPDIPDMLAKIVMKALEKDRNIRYHTAGEMLNDLYKFQSSTEFDPEADTLAKMLKRDFASHFIKMNKVLERAQAAYIMDELFKDISDLDEIDLNEKVRIGENDEMFELHKEQVPPEKKLSLGLTAFFAFLFFILVGGGLGAYFYYSGIKEREKISLFSSPPGAKIFINGEDIGFVTPAEIELIQGENYIIEFKKSHFIGGTTFIPSEENNTINMKLKKVDTGD